MLWLRSFSPFESHLKRARRSSNHPDSLAQQLQQVTTTSKNERACPLWTSFSTCNPISCLPSPPSPITTTTRALRQHSPHSHHLARPPQPQLSPSCTTPPSRSRRTSPPTSLPPPPSTPTPPTFHTPRTLIRYATPSLATARTSGTELRASGRQGAAWRPSREARARSPGWQRTTRTCS